MYMTVCLRVTEGKEHPNNGFTQLNIIEPFISQRYNLECFPTYHRTQLYNKRRPEQLTHLTSIVF